MTYWLWLLLQYATYNEQIQEQARAPFSTPPNITYNKNQR